MAVINKLPFSLSRSPDSASLYVRSGIAYNYAIGGLPFLSAASPENPIIRESVPFQKDQIDDQAIPGEQTLSNWWLRSQQSFHGGAGQVYSDPSDDNPFSSIRFRTSRNVDVWTPGELKLLPEATPVDTSPITGILDSTGFVFGDGTSAVAAVTNTSVIFVTEDDHVVHTFGGSTVVQSITSNGSHLFVAARDGVWSAPIPASLATAPVWTKQYTYSDAGPVVIEYVKKRLILGAGPSVYELPASPDSPPAALPPAHFTSENASWEWTSITEVSSAILIAGNAGGVRGAILKLTLGDDGDIVSLSAPATALQLPFGEVPYSVVGYLGRLVAIGTDRGVRIGVADELGNIEYGPLLFETEGPVKAWTARDRFLWCTVTRASELDSGLYRIDLSQQLAQLRFPYAVDLIAESDSAECRTVAHLGTSDKLFFATSADAYVQSDNLAPSGYLQTGRIRFNTLEPKVYKRIRLRGPALTGGLAVVILDQNDGQAAVHALSPGNSIDREDISIFAPSTPTDFISIRFDLTRDSTDPTVGPTMWAYQLKALPAPPRQRFIQLPLLCFDWEIDPRGQRHGGLGEAKRRLLALEALEARSIPVVLQEFDIGLATEVVIERVSFEQTAPPPKTEGWGGIVTVTLRTL